MDSSVEPRINQVTLPLKAIVDDPALRADIDLFIRAYNDQLISDRQLTLPALVVQALVDLFYTSPSGMAAEDAPDLSIKAIADASQRLLNDLDPGALLTPKKVGHILSEDLGLTARTRRSRHRRLEVLLGEADLAALMQRYGIADPRGEGGPGNLTPAPRGTPTSGLPPLGASP